MNRDDTRVTNKHYDKDIKRTFQYTRWIFEILGVWPMITNDSSIRSKFISKFVIIFCLLNITFTMLPATLHTILRERNLMARLMLIAPVTASLTSFAKYLIIIFRINMIKLCVQNIQQDWMMIENDHDRAIMTKTATISRKITIFFSVFLYTGGMSYHAILPIVKGAKINEFNVTIRPVVYPGYDIFVDPQRSPTYEIIFVFTCVSAFMRYTVTLAVCNLAALFVTHACGQMDIVMSRLTMIFDGIVKSKESIEVIEDRISFVIRSHSKCLRLSAKIDETLKEIMLIEVMVLTLIICLLEYYCMTEWNNSDTLAIITYFILLVSYTFNIFTLCYIGELLKEKFQTVGQSAYMIEWYRFPGKNALSIVLIMAMSNYPRKLTAGRMMELSVCSFGSIIKSSLTYLNMLRTVSD